MCNNTWYIWEFKFLNEIMKKENFFEMLKYLLQKDRANDWTHTVQALDLMCNCKNRQEEGGGGGGGSITHPKLWISRQPFITQEKTSAHLIKTVDGQPEGNLSVCSEMGKLINEMTGESKDGQEKG